MAVFPRSPLYRMARWFVICGTLVSCFPQIVPAQAAHGAKASKAPRALGLLVLSPNGKAHLIPITILIDGRYFDASAYKAAPVPMALWSDTVYEAFRTGVSEGLFTVTGALERKDTNEWMGEGKWESASSIAAKVPKKPASSVPRGLNEDEGPPVLRRAGTEKPKPPEAPVTPPPSVAPPAPAASSGSTPATNTPASSAPSASTASASAGLSPSISPGATPSADQDGKTQPDSSPEDKDRPVLRRGKPAPASKAATRSLAVASATAAGNTPAKAATTASSGAASSTPSSSGANAVQLIPAISDSGGPEPRPYAYDAKPDEAAAFRKKMLALAAEEVRTRSAQLANGASSSTAVSSPHGKPRLAKPLSPNFEDVQLRVFDLASVNEPELVLTATARMPRPPTARDGASPDLEFMVTLVAREDVNGEFHKALANVTDTQHLDVLPRLELIDAVDVDGDGRGELLFRQASDAGSAFVVYRVIGDRLYPLFQGVPSGS